MNKLLCFDSARAGSIQNRYLPPRGRIGGKKAKISSDYIPKFDGLHSRGVATFATSFSIFGLPRTLVYK
jgi:hypothetical protein